MNDDGEHVGGVTGFLKSIGLAIRTFRPTRVVIPFDGKGGSARRRRLYSEYKANRKSMVRLNRTYDFGTIEKEEEARKKQLMLLGRLLKHLPVTMMAPPYIEADDTIAYLANLVVEREGKVIIMSTDKDFLQIVSENVEVYNPITKRVMTVDTVVEDFGIHPNNFAIFRAMDGDKSDNIAGIKGVGAKSLVKQYPHLREATVSDIDAIIDFAEKQNKGLLFEKIRHNREIIERNFELMRLDTQQMSQSTRLVILKKFDDLSALNLERKELTDILVQYKMTNTLGNYPQWLTSTFAPLVRK